MSFLDASPQAIWRQRVAGSLGSLAAVIAVGLVSPGQLSFGPAGWASLAASAAAYILALRASGRPTAQLGWGLAAMDLAVLAVLMTATGGAASPFQALIYPWLFGVALAQLHGGSSAPIGAMCLGAAAALLAGAFGSPGVPLFVAVHAVGLVAVGLAAGTLLLERRRNQVDPLVGVVLSRGAGLERLEGWLRARHDFTLAFIDLGGFKAINDQFGHRVGDEVLSAVADRLRGAAGPEDIVARHGGDEFVLASRDPAVADGIAGLFDGPVRTSVGPLVVRADVGLATPERGDDVERLLERADAAMYETKRSHSDHRPRLTLAV